MIVAELAPPAPAPVDCSLSSEPNAQSSIPPSVTAAYAARDISDGNPKWSRCQKLALRKPYESGGVDCYDSSLTRGNESWAIATLPPASEGDYAAWQLVYLGSDEREAMGGWQTASLERGDPAIAGNDAPSAPYPLALVDFDGDGRTELVTSVTAWSDAAGHGFTHVEVWSALAGSVGVLGQTSKRHFIDVVDVDGNGRPELLEDPYGVLLGSALGWIRSKRLWSRLVELDARGNPTDDGALARAFARRQCTNSARLLAGLADAEVQCIAGYMHCASVFRLPADAVTKALDARCSRAKGEDELWCRDSRETWLGIAASKQPFVITTEGAAP